MHIAICDDNIADRKHLERLLSRESDKRAGTKNLLYVDAFGNKENLMRNPLLYDMIFLDMTGTPTLAEEIVTELMEHGYKAPLVLYSSTINYQENERLPESIIHMQKPYIPAPLPGLLKIAEDYINSQDQKLAIRSVAGTSYVRREDILCGQPRKANLALYLKDGSFIEILGEPWEFYLNLKPYKEFYQLNDKVVINMKYISLLTPFTLILYHKKEFHISPFTYYAIRKRQKKLYEA